MTANVRLIFFLILLYSSATPAQVSQTIHQTFTIESADKISVDLDRAQNILFKETKGSRILVETTVQLSLPNQSLLEFVIKNGRYDLIKSIDNTRRALTLSSKKKNNVIVVKGQECQEFVSYTIYIPVNIHLSEDSSLTGTH